MFETQEIRDNTRIVINVPGVDEWTTTDLRNCCKKNKVKGYTKMDREQLITEVNKILDNLKSR